MIEEDELDADKPRSGGSTWRKKALAGLLALLLVGTVAGSLVGGTRDTSDDDTTTTTTDDAASTSTTADRATLVDAGVALAAALTPVPSGDVTGAVDQNTLDAALVDIVGTGWYDRASGERFVFVRTRGGPPPELTGCFQLRVNDTSAGAPAAQGEVNIGGPCASAGAFEKGRMAGFLLPEGALFLLELDVTVGAGAADAGVVATQLLVDGATTLADSTPVLRDAPPITVEVAEALLPLASFRDANPPDGPVAPSD